MDPKRNARKILPALVGALFASLGTTPVLAQSAPTTQQLMRMIEAQQKQLDNLKSALNRAQTQAQAAATKADSAAKSAASIPGLPKNVTIGGKMKLNGIGIGKISFQKIGKKLFKNQKLERST